MGSGTEKEKTFLECHFNHVNEHSPMYLEFKDDSLLLSAEFHGNWGLQGDEGVVWIHVANTAPRENLRSLSLGIDI